MTEQELKEMNDFNRKSLEKEAEARKWALELGWKFDTRMAYLNYYIEPGYKYEPACSDWMSENPAIYDCIYRTTKDMDWNKSEIFFKGIIKDKDDLESKMKEFGIPITKAENTEVVNQIRLGKEQTLTPNECKEVNKLTLKDLL